MKLEFHSTHKGINIFKGIKGQSGRYMSGQWFTALAYYGSLKSAMDDIERQDEATLATYQKKQRKI